MQITRLYKMNLFRHKGSDNILQISRQSVQLKKSFVISWHDQSSPEIDTTHNLNTKIDQNYAFHICTH